MMQPDPECCLFCYAWVPRDMTPPIGGRGQCRRHAPRPLMIKLDPVIDEDGDFAILWPDTGAMDWCGDFKHDGIDRSETFKPKGSPHTISKATQPPPPPPRKR